MSTVLPPPVPTDSVQQNSLDNDSLFADALSRIGKAMRRSSSCECATGCFEMVDAVRSSSTGRMFWKTSSSLGDRRSRSRPPQKPILPSGAVIAAENGQDHAEVLAHDEMPRQTDGKPTQLEGQQDCTKAKDAEDTSPAETTAPDDADEATPTDVSPEGQYTTQANKDDFPVHGPRHQATIHQDAASASHDKPPVMPPPGDDPRPFPIEEPQACVDTHPMLPPTVDESLQFPTKEIADLTAVDESERGADDANFKPLKVETTEVYAVPISSDFRDEVAPMESEAEPSSAQIWWQRKLREQVPENGNCPEEIDFPVTEDVDMMETMVPKIQDVPEPEVASDVVMLNKAVVYSYATTPVSSRGPSAESDANSLKEQVPVAPPSAPRLPTLVEEPKPETKQRNAEGYCGCPCPNQRSAMSSSSRAEQEIKKIRDQTSIDEVQVTPTGFFPFCC